MNRAEKRRKFKEYQERLKTDPAFKAYNDLLEVFSTKDEDTIEKEYGLFNIVNLAMKAAENESFDLSFIDGYIKKMNEKLLSENEELPHLSKEEIGK